MIGLAVQARAKTLSSTSAAVTMRTGLLQDWYVRAAIFKSF